MLDVIVNEKIGKQHFQLVRHKEATGTVACISEVVSTEIGTYQACLP